MDETENAQGIVPIQGQVTMRRKSTKKEKNYRAGHGTHWVADNDLNSGFYN